MSTNTINPQFSLFGKKVLKEVSQLKGYPILLIGDTGWGKSVLVREAARINNMPYDAINAHPGMDIGTLVGMWRPVPINNTISIKWQDGVLTNSVKRGGCFLFEEMTRAPQEMVSRLFGLLDNGFRYWSIPEAGDEVDVNNDFWFIGTANQVKEGYSTVKLDAALHSRFVACFTINQPLADEGAVLSEILSPDMQVKLQKIITDLRRGGKMNINTRDIVLVAKLLQKGMSLERAFEISMIPKYPAYGDGMIEIVLMHTES